MDVPEQTKMKLIIDFHTSCPAERCKNGVQTPAPVFLTHDGVSGHIRVDSAQNSQVLSGANTEVRLVSMGFYSLSKI